MLNVENLYVQIEDNKIVKGISLAIESGDVHLLLGPNGSGKSTFCKALAGAPETEIIGGTVTFNGEDLADMPVEKRAQKGLILSFQNPPEIAGLSVANFLKYAINENRRANGETPLTAPEFFQEVYGACEYLGIDRALLTRGLNENFSGGEKKKCEMLQLLLLKPKVALLDEPDSGVDIDAQKIILKTINTLREQFGTKFLIITHTMDFALALPTTHVHIFKDGNIAESGGHELLERLQREGYSEF